MVFTKKSVQRSNKIFEFARDEAIFLKLLTLYGMMINEKTNLYQSSGKVYPKAKTAFDCFAAG